MSAEALSPAAAVDAHGDFTAHAEHFQDASAEKRAAQLGMWLFLAQEILLFAGLFCSFVVYRYLYHDTFRYLAATQLDWKLGTLNTVVLLISSFTVVLAVDAGRKKKTKAVAIWYALSILLAGVFLVVKYFEYSHKIHVGTLPGKYFSFDLTKELLNNPPDAKLHVDPSQIGQGAPMFFTLYFIITGLHGIHVLIGMGILAWVGIRAWKGEFARRNDTPVELSGMYWHLVDLIWIFVYPMIYLL